MKKTLIVLAASLSMSGAFAQSATQPAAPAHKAVAHHRAIHREMGTEERIAHLRSALKITPQQESQWNTFADVMRSNDTTMSQLYQAAKDQSALDDIKQYARISQAQADCAQKLASAFEPLYNSLSPAQKATASRIFNERRQAIARRMRHHQHHQRRHHHPHARGAAPASGVAPASDAAAQ